MPRLNLTDEEAKLILRQREIEDAHRAGWNKAITEVYTRISGITFEDKILHTDILNSIKELERGQT